ncbi:unnamed protein product [Ectocarpus sp. 13 AM-2016]
MYHPCGEERPQGQAQAQTQQSGQLRRAVFDAGLQNIRERVGRLQDVPHELRVLHENFIANGVCGWGSAWQYNRVCKTHPERVMNFLQTKAEEQKHERPGYPAEAQQQDAAGTSMPDVYQKLMPQEPWQEKTRASSRIPQAEPAASAAVFVNVETDDQAREGRPAGAGIPNLEPQERNENRAATLIPQTEPMVSEEAMLIDVGTDDLTRPRHGAEISMPDVQRQLEPQERQEDERWAATPMAKTEPGSLPLSTGNGGLTARQSGSLLQSSGGRIRPWSEARWLPWKQLRNTRRSSLATPRPSSIVSPYTRRENDHRNRKMRTRQQYGQAVVDIDEVLVKQAVRQATAAIRNWGPGATEIESIRELQAAELESSSSLEAGVTSGAAHWGGVRLDTISATDGDLTAVPALWVQWHEHQKEQQKTQWSEHQIINGSSLSPRLTDLSAAVKEHGANTKTKVRRMTNPQRESFKRALTEWRDGRAKALDSHALCILPDNEVGTVKELVSKVPVTQDELCTIGSWRGTRKLARHGVSLVTVIQAFLDKNGLCLSEESRGA